MSNRDDATGKFKGYSQKDLQVIVEAYTANDDNFMLTAQTLNIPRSTVVNKLVAAEKLGLIELKHRKPYIKGCCVDGDSEKKTEQIHNLLMKGPTTLDELKEKTKLNGEQLAVALAVLRSQGVNIQRGDNRIEICTEQCPAYISGPGVELVSRKNNTFLFGAMGDLHAASKYCRWDVREDLIHRVEAAGGQAIFDTGNWIDGESRFNKYDLEAYGMNRQCQLLAEKHPHTKLPIYAVSGDDHEGWVAQREGVNIGDYAAKIMRRAGHNWTDLGFMEAHVLLKNVNTGVTAIMAVCHPGGGSAYATSYSIQKIIECVPVDSEILTLMGWKNYDEVAVGDSVLGYNIKTDRCEWTNITALNHGVGDLTRYHNDQFDVYCTHNHNWALEWEQRAGSNKNSKIPAPYSCKDKLLGTIEESKTRSRIIQAAVAPDGPGMPPVNHQDWLHKDLAPAYVLMMTARERRAFIEGMLIGEGTIAHTKGYRTVCFSQNTGPVLDAFRLACFLEGIATTCKHRPGGSYKPEVNHHRGVTLLSKRMRICDRIKSEPAGVAEVWCPTTGLGTWVMRQGSLITITGNSLEGGEKPAVGLYGHFHKLWAGNIRNVWAIQTGTAEEQTPFMRKKRLEAHVGGVIVELEQHPESGAIIACTPKMVRYFNKGFYSGRWSKHGGVVLPDRSVCV